MKEFISGFTAENHKTEGGNSKRIYMSRYWNKLSVEVENFKDIEAVWGYLFEIQNLAKETWDFEIVFESKKL